MSPAHGTTTLTIDALGAKGDGVAMHDGRPVHIPFTLPGETVTVEIDDGRVRLASIGAPSPDRVGPRCAHYTECGGCSLQHAADTAYLAFKRQLVVDALAAKGIDAGVAPAIASAPRTRRRAAFAAARGQGGVVIGFHGRRSHSITPISDCAVVTPGLLALLPKLKALAAVAVQPKDALTLTATETGTGVDLAITGARKNLSADDKQRMIALAGGIGLARLSLNGDMLVELRQPVLRVGEAYLAPAPGGFLQASAASESEMTRLVSEAVGPARRIADLFAGAGTFALRLAATATVHAVESDAPALAALEKAARTAPALNPVTTERRDLFRQPLTPADLKRFDAVVIDPPRAGAEDQSRALAASKVKRIAMVSCNATTFARDLRILVDGGYRVDRVTPVDQFLWSAHIEVVAALSR